MNEPFILALSYQNRELEFPAAFQRYGFTYRIAVVIEEITYLFEPDEEGQYRALTEDHPDKKPDTGLLQAVAEKLAQLN